MIKKFVSRYGFKLAALALVIGQVSASIPCRGELHNKITSGGDSYGSGN